MVYWILGGMVFFLALEIYLTFSTHHANRAQNERVAEAILKDPQTFPPFSEKAKAFVERLCEEKGLVSKPILLTGVFIQNVGKEDYLSLLGLDSTMLSIPREKIKILNELLEKDVCSGEEQDQLDEITFLISHEIEHLKKHSSGSYFSALSFEKILSVLKLVLFLLVVELLVWLGLSLMTSLFSSWILVACLIVLLKTVNTCSEEYMCDLKSSQNPAILKAGARWAEREALPFAQAIIKANYIGSMLNNVAPDFACAFSTMHPHPKKRAQRLLDRAEKLR